MNNSSLKSTGYFTRCFLHFVGLQNILRHFPAGHPQIHRLLFNVPVGLRLGEVQVLDEHAFGPVY